MVMRNMDGALNERLLLGRLAVREQPADDVKTGPTIGPGIGGGAGPAAPGGTPPAGQPSVPIGPIRPFPPIDFIPPRDPLPPPIPTLPPDLDIPRYQGPQTSTILARSAFALLEHASRENLDLALNTLANKNIPAERLIEELERSPFSFQQVLSELARGWRQEDINGFAEKFGMPREQLDVMDAIVSLAILNDPALEARLRAENQAPATPADFLSSRRVVWQSVEPGSVLNPPYVILVAVEAVDSARPDDVVQSILGQLAVFRGYKLPQAAVARLSGSQIAMARPILLNPRVASLLANRVTAVAPRPLDLALRPEG